MHAVTVFLAVLAVAAANLSPADLSIHYKQGHEYTYLVEQQLASTLAGEQQNAVQRFRSLLKCHAASEKKAICKLSEIQMAKINDDLKTDDQLVPFEQLRKVNVKPQHLKVLELPFEMNIDHGHLSELIFSEKDKLFSENIKRGIVNSFQLSLSQQEEPAQHFRANETSIDGHCETLYTILPEDSCRFKPKQMSCVRIVKNVNFERCQVSSELRYNYHRLQQERNQYSGKSDGIQRSTVIELELKRETSEDFVVFFSRTTAEYTVPLTLTQNQYLQARVVTELRLQNVRQSETIPEVESKKQAQSLRYNDEFDLLRERFYANGDEKYLEEQNYLTKSNVADAVLNLLKALSQTFVADSAKHWEMDSRAPQLFFNLVSLLRHASASEVEQIHEAIYTKNMFDDSVNRFVKSVMVDALASAGTHTTVTHLLTKFRSELSEEKTASLLKRIGGNVPVVSQEIVRSLWKLCDMHTEKKEMHKLCVLAWSRLANNLCQQRERTGDLWVMEKRGEQMCTEEFKNELNEKLKSLLTASSEASSRILALKAYGNMALDLSIHQIESVIRDQSLDKLQRQVAIDAFRLFGRRMNRRIARVLMPVCMDKNEYPEIRMEALRILLNDNVEDSVVDQITYGIMRDANMNIKSFTASCLVDLAQRLEQRNVILSQKLYSSEQMIRQSLPASEQHRFSNKWARQSSQNIADTIYSFSSILSNNSYIPKNFQVSADAWINQHLLPMFMQAGIRQQNVEKLIEQFLTKLESENRFLVRGRRSAMQNMVDSPVQTLKNMFEQLKIVARRDENVPQMLIYKREQGMDVAFAYADEKNLPEALAGLLTDAQLDLSGYETDGEKQVYYSGAEMTIEQILKVPTVFGVPLVYSVHAAHIYNTNGKTKVTLKTTGNAVDEAEFMAKMTPKVSTQVLHKLEAVSPLMTVGVQNQLSLDAQIPLEINGKYNEKGLQVEMKLPTEQKHTYKLLQVSSHPSTLTREWPSESKVYIESEDRTLHVRRCQPLFRELQKQTVSPMTGLRFELRGHYHVLADRDCVFVGENTVQFHAHVEKNSADRVKLNLKLENEALKQSETPKMLMKLLDGAHVEQIFKNAKSNEKSIVREFAEKFESKSAVRTRSKMTFEALANNEQFAKFEKNIKVTCDSTLTVCSLDSELRFRQQGQEGWKALLVGQMARPELNGIHGGIKSQHVIAHAEVHFSKYSDQDKNTVSLCLYGRPLASQAQELEGKLSSESPDYVMNEMFTRIPATHFTVLMESQLNSWTTKHIRPFVKFVQFYSNPMSMIYSTQWSAERELPRHSVLKNDIIVDAGVIRIITDDEHETELTVRHQQHKRNGRIEARHDLARCTLDNKHNIRSFSGESYKIPLTSCYTVLSADCSSDHPKYAILAKEDENQRLIVQLLTPRGAFSIRREAKTFIVKLNGDRIPEEQFQRYGISVLRQTETQVYVFHCHKTGMEVRFNGESASVHLPEDFVNRQCGVCGQFSNSNGESRRMSNNQLADTLKEFHASYLYRDSECQNDKLEKTLESRTEKDYERDDDYESVESSELQNLTNKKSNQRQVKPQKAQRLREFREYVCFSKATLPKCPHGYAAEGLATEEKEFVCVDRHQHGVHKLKQQILDGEVVEDIKDLKGNSKLFDFEMPKRCVRVNDYY
ncbi:unnamed protein product [Bursaphelenchus okinawaensis]|uniref:Vitellogenin n=1 Tax=Bursaphelenchus okinawaensis TaxID=465554 RepID=A0A811L721_9BILA|nr:unnamed protein product [Bursaphelenchus okinawaensis]CAG9119437.1 unnamed protein product [Bursaphelenchus okinawaensis]